MTIRERIFIGYFLIVALAFFMTSKWIRDDVRTHYLESLEETMVDSVNIMAALLEESAKDSKLDTALVEKVMKNAHARNTNAKIYKLVKAKIDLDIYVTDDKGIVLYDSGKPENIGRDFSKWNDVYHTLKGTYGVRSTRLKSDDPTTSTHYVAAPVRAADGRLIGVVSAYKPSAFINKCIQRARYKISMITLSVLLMILLTGYLTSRWLTTPIMRLVKYATDVKEGRNPVLPPLGNSEIAKMGKAMEEMRITLEGKKYVENYVQNLTHELKSPIAATKGAVEILSSPTLTNEQREKFLSNIAAENERMQHIVDRMLKLSELENIRGHVKMEEVPLGETVGGIVEKYQKPDSSQILFNAPEHEIFVKAEPFLIYEAVDNLVSNAVDFTPAGGRIEINISKTDEDVLIAVTNEGPQIPDYALERLFEKFYSLPRPGTNRKSSGLGLSIVKEIAELHSGSIKVFNVPPSSVRAELRIKA